MSLHLITGYAGQEHITSADFGSFNISFVGDGEYVFDRGNKFACSIGGATSVTISDGDGLMQGRHFRQKENTVQDLVFDAGEAGLYRNDLVCVQYSKSAENFVERTDFVIIKGTPSATEEDVQDPTYTHGDITERGSATLNQMPLYRVHISGVAISQVTPLFTVIKNYEDLAGDLQDQVDDAIEEIRSKRAYYVAHTIAANGWDANNAYSFETLYPHTQYNILEIYPTESTTQAQRRAWNNGAFNGYYSTNRIIVGGFVGSTDGAVPIVDIPVNLYIEEI